jgi:hypothetical protein
MANARETNRKLRLEATDAARVLEECEQLLAEAEALKREADAAERPPRDESDSIGTHRS